MQRQLTLIDWIALLASVLIGGSAFVAIKFGLHGIGPYWLVAGRLAVAGLVMSILLHGRFRFPTLGEWPLVLMIGTMGWTVGLCAVQWASLYISASAVGMMMAAGPIAVALVSLVMLPEEKLTLWRSIGLAVGFAGVGMIILGRTASPNAGLLADTEMGHSLWPYVVLLLSMLGFAISTIMTRKATHIPALTKGVGALIGGAITSTLFAAVFEPFPIAPTSTALIAFAYLAVINTGFNGVLIYWLIDRTSARFVAQSNYLMPISTLALGALLLGDMLTPLQYVGIGVVLGGVLLSERRGKARAGPPAPQPAAAE